ncbi:flavin-containing monooxygenase [Kitasatospora sp. NPDC056783]|uniref:flavin-containing monooxygenase n=1 Tax=Kitasatospora sp. NPDC056783 TaxID=3345943 RepID=UPI00369D8B8C
MDDGNRAPIPRLRVCVIGAGVSGIVAAKTFHEEGHEVTVFERSDQLGGVWNPRRAYAGLTTQTPGDQYAFSDFPTPADHPDWPSARHVQAYLRAYAERFGVAPLICYRSTVVRARPRGAGAPSWSVTVDAPTGRSTREFDFLLVCNGIFSAPHVPDLPGTRRFTTAGGTVLHTSDCGSAELFRGRRVVVVGFGKSAMDIAATAAPRAREVHLVVRRAVWTVPRFFGGLVHIRHVCTSRLWESLMPSRSPGPARLEAGRRRLLALLWRAVELLLSCQFRLRASGLRPAHRFGDQVASGFQVAPAALFRLVRAGRIQVHRAGAEGFTAEGAVLSDGRVLAADVVVLGTGYRQELPFLDPALAARIVDPEGRYRLYRCLVSPEVPGLGFVGYNSSLFTPTTSELGARWLAAHATGRIALPSPPEMHRAIDAELLTGKAVRPLSGRFSGTHVVPYTYSYLDGLQKDLRKTRNPRGMNAVRRYLKPFSPHDYALDTIRRGPTHGKP